MDSICKTDKHEEVSAYYGETLEKSDDLKTNACCTVKAYPPRIQEALGMIHDEVLEKYYGCGLTLPDGLEGLRVLDLGSGSGRDCYLVSYLVGAQGSVVGIDMTDEQLDVARRHIDYHTEKFGYTSPNVEFKKGLIEKLDEVGLENHSFDVAISNCVINLCPNKPAALKEIFRVLKSGGQFYFSDVYSNEPVPERLIDDPVLYGECLSGALSESNFIQMALDSGFREPVEIERSVITIDNEEVSQKVGDLKFHSITYSMHKD